MHSPDPSRKPLPASHFALQTPFTETNPYLQVTHLVRSAAQFAQPSPQGLQVLLVKSKPNPASHSEHLALDLSAIYPNSHWSQTYAPVELKEHLMHLSAVQGTHCSIWFTNYLINPLVTSQSQVVYCVVGSWVNFRLVLHLSHPIWVLANSHPTTSVNTVTGSMSAHFPSFSVD